MRIKNLQVVSTCLSKSSWKIFQNVQGEERDIIFIIFATTSKWTIMGI